MLSDIMSLPTKASIHDHDYHQLVVVLSGETDFDIAGKDQQLYSGSGCLVPASEAHRFAGQEHNKIMVVNLPTQQSQTTTIEEYDHLAKLFDKACYFHLPFRIQQLATQLSQELEQHPQDKFLARACGNMLLGSLRYQFSLPSLYTQKARKQNGRPLNMALLDDFIEQHLSRRLLVDELASCCFLGVSQFHHRFKQTTGVSPHQYILQKRLSRAQTLLSQGMSLSDVAVACGFANQGAMSKTFSQMLGISPRRYQQQSIN
ncbi:AraC family transcriptional regulator [Marinomonas agarivorans]|nr:AraC family transcriptional regulator [Marinomonas agarivorans]